MCNYSMLALLLLALLWACPAWGGKRFPAFTQISPEAQALMDNHRCADGSTLSEVLKVAEPWGMKLLSAQIISLDGGQKALQVEYCLLPRNEVEVFKLLWSLDSEGRQFQAPLSSNYLDSPEPGRLTAEIAELGKACWLANIDYFYDWYSTWNKTEIGTYDPKEGKFIPIPDMDPKIRHDPSFLAAVPAQGFVDGLAGLVKQAGLWVQDFGSFVVPPRYVSFGGTEKNGGIIDVPGVYIEVCLKRNAPTIRANPEDPLALLICQSARWRRAPGSQTFEPMDDIARQLSAGIVPPEIK